MKPMIYRFFFTMCCWLMVSTVSAQDMSGIWRGYFVTDTYDHYKFELQIKQSGNSVSGVSYSYLSTVFYGKATLTGSYNKAGKKILIQEIRTVELRMSDGSAACIMKCNFVYSRSGKEEFLEGTYTSKFEKDGLLNKKGGDCGGGKVYLRRVANSDFYIEPFLRGKVKPGPVLVNKAPVKTNPADKKTTPVTVNKAPVKKDTAKAKVSPPIVKKPVVTPKPVIRKDSAVVKPVTGNIAKNDSAIRKSKPVLITPAPPDIKNRINELVKTLNISSNQVTVKLFDNGEIDGDTISVYLDNKLVLSDRRLTAAPLILRFDMNEQQDEHELTMVAENLGTIPPNTSLMIVEAGTQRFEVRITSTEQKNAVVKFRYLKPDKQ